MSQTIHTVLDLSEPVDKLSFREVFWEKGGSSPDNVPVRLSEAQLIALIKVLFTYGLHYDEVRGEKRPTFMESIKYNTNGMFDIPQSFCGHLLNNLHKGAKSQFQKFLEMEHDLRDLLSNEQLMDFVEMQLIDPSVSYRKWEYGRYALDHMAKELLIDLDWEAERSRIAWYNIPMDDYLVNVEKGLTTFGAGLDNHEKGFLILLCKTNVLEQDSTLMDYMLAGDIVQSNLVGLHLRKEQLATVLKKTIENGLSKGRDKKGPKP
ncbi:hypothetical protein [Flagellimonas flava]|uniref:hypothetical protein n=1 Tax=Flagellimonas TaxID=444459 RepID=UPI003D6526BA